MKTFGTKKEVYTREAQRTKGNLLEKDIKLSKGKYVSVKKSNNSSHLSKWTDALKKARKELKIEGFMAPKKTLPNEKKPKPHEIKQHELYMLTMKYYK